MNYIINKNLVAGDYLLTDSAGKQAQVSFTRDGLINGFAPFRAYYIKNDIGGEPMNNLDEIIFDLWVPAKSRQKFAYKIKGDHLTLYNSYPNDNFTASIIGKPVYRLVKQHKAPVSVP